MLTSSRDYVKLHPMPERLFDAELANEIANSPGVFESLVSDSRIDFGPTVANPANVILHDDGGIAVCIRSAPRVYEAHLFFPADVRGRRTLDATQRMLAYMMPGIAKVMWVQPPRHAKGAIWLARQCGFVFEEIAEHALLGQVVYMSKGLD